MYVLYNKSYIQKKKVYIKIYFSIITMNLFCHVFLFNEIVVTKIKKNMFL